MESFFRLFAGVLMRPYLTRGPKPITRKRAFAPDEPVDPDAKSTFTKAEQFMIIVQAACVASDRCKSPENLSWDLPNILARAFDVCDRIPAKLSVSEAARYFIEVEINREERDLEDYMWNLAAEPVPDWLGIKERREWRQQLANEPIKTLYGRTWVVEDPNWPELPFDDLNSLRLMTLLRYEEHADLKALARAVPRLNKAKTREEMKRFVDEGWAEFSGTDAAPAWSATRKLLRTRTAKTPLKPKPIEASPPAIHRWNETPEQTQARVSALRKARDARNDELFVLRPTSQAALAAIKDARAGLPGREIMATAVPTMDRLEVTRMLKRLRNLGYLEVSGATRNAIWKGTDKLKAMFVEAKRAERAAQRKAAKAL